MGMDGSRWIWVIGSAFSPYSRYLLAIWTFLWFVLRVLYGLCYSVIMLSKDIFRRLGTGTILLLLFLLFLLLETGRLQKTRGVESLLACIHTLLFCRDCGDSLSG